jgi:hypothetical protein
LLTQLKKYNQRLSLAIENQTMSLFARMIIQMRQKRLKMLAHDVSNACADGVERRNEEGKRERGYKSLTRPLTHRLTMPAHVHKCKQIGREQFDWKRRH